MVTWTNEEWSYVLNLVLENKRMLEGHIRDIETGKDVALISNEVDKAITKYGIDLTSKIIDSLYLLDNGATLEKN